MFLLFQKGIIAGLLSSSCCFLQLILNALSWWNILHVGCAGFNKVLGPPRPYFRAMTIGWLGLTWFLRTNTNNGCGGHSHSHSSRQLLLITVMTIGLMVLPELLQAWGTHVTTTTSTTTLHPILRRTIESSSSTAAAEDLIASSMLLEYEAQFIVDNMGCEACESNVKNILEAHVRHATVHWQTGLVTVKSDTEIKLNMLSERLEYHGYSLHEDLNYFTKHHNMEDNGKLQWSH